MTPDERIYVAQAHAVRAGGFQAFRDLAGEYNEVPVLGRYPSPLRWLWIAVMAVFGSWRRAIPWMGLGAACACTWLLGHELAGVEYQSLAWVILAVSPLGIILAKEILQDTTAAALTLAAMYFAALGNPVGVGASITALVCVKEAGWLVVPALLPFWWHSGASWSILVVAVALAGMAWVAACLGLFGRQAWHAFHKARRSHNTTYTREYQQGAPHRLFVDLALLSPVALGLAIIGATHAPELAAAVGLLLAVHALQKVRNVRIVLAAELLVRALAVVAMNGMRPLAAAISLTACLAMDAYIVQKTRRVFDPVTDALSAVLGMSPPSQ